MGEREKRRQCRSSRPAVDGREVDEEKDDYIEHIP